MNAVYVLLVAALACSVGCSSKARDRFNGGDDDASADGDGGDTDLTGDSVGPDSDPTLGGPCKDDAQCVRPSVPCGIFKCDKTIGRCRATPDDTKCDDGNYCNGAERCDTKIGCIPGAVIDCSSGDTCAIDRCIEETRKCEHAPRDADGDGDPPAVCTKTGGKDCDDLDPTVSSKAAEICGNKKDDNCNGMIDESPCVAPSHATCATALAITKSGTYALDLSGTTRTIATTCAPTASFFRQNVVSLVVPAGSGQDVEIMATPSTTGTRAALSMAKTCGGSDETDCLEQYSFATSVSLKKRSLAPGTYPLYVFATAEGALELKVTFLPPTPAPTNTSCTTAAPLFAAGKTTATVLAEVETFGTSASACSFGLGPLFYRVDIPASLGASDLQVRATSPYLGGTTVLGLRSAACDAASDELRCGQGHPASLFARGLVPGTYYVTVGGYSNDMTIEASLVPATAAPADASCTGAPALVKDTTILVDLKGHEDHLSPTCLGLPKQLAPDAAYDLNLAVDSDVLVVARTTGGDSVGLALSSPACTSADIGCGRGSPLRLNRRAQAAGDYRVVVESTYASKVYLSTFVRPAATPGPEGADGCSTAAVLIPPDGGLFVGSTAGKTADFPATCDAPAPAKTKGAPDVIYRLDVAKKSRIVLDTAGSAFTTTVSIGKGASCPGVALLDVCAAGLFIDNAFLDVTVDPGVYWIIVDGYNLASGSYRLDVRVAPPPPIFP